MQIDLRDGFAEAAAVGSVGVGGIAEVPEDLERRVESEEVGREVPFQSLAEELVGVDAIVEAGPDVDFPCLAPARRAVATGVPPVAFRAFYSSAMFSCFLAATPR